MCVCGFLFLSNLAYKPRVKLIHSCQLLFVNINIQGACHDCLFWSVCFVKEREINKIKTTRLSFLADSFTLHWNRLRNLTSHGKSNVPELLQHSFLQISLSHIPVIYNWMLVNETLSLPKGCGFLVSFWPRAVLNESSESQHWIQQLWTTALNPTQPLQTPW